MHRCPSLVKLSNLTFCTLATIAHLATVVDNDERFLAAAALGRTQASSLCALQDHTIGTTLPLMRLRSSAGAAPGIYVCARKARNCTDCSAGQPSLNTFTITSHTLPARPRAHPAVCSGPSACGSTGGTPGAALGNESGGWPTRKRLMNVDTVSIIFSESSS
jgi:hypothetical protein